MRKKFHVKKGDEVVVITGKEKGKRGKIIEVITKKDRVIVEGLQIIKRHTKARSNRNQAEGAIIEREGTIHVSNVMKSENYDARKAKRAAAAPATQA
jgi:large subunit ribosomal protein L24